MTAIGMVSGVGIALGVLLVVAGLRGSTVSRRPSVLAHVRRVGLRLGIGIGVGVIALGVTGWPVAGALAGAFAAFAPRIFGGTKRQKLEIERTEAVATWAEMLRDTMAGAAGIEQAIIATAHAAPAVIQDEVRSLARRLERQPLTSALAMFADEMAHPTADLIVAALTLASSKQAKRLGELLGTLATAARQDATMRLRVDAGRARTRTSVQVVVGATVTMAAGMLLLNRGYLEPYGSAVGQLVLAAVGLCFAASFVWLDRMTNVAAPGRIFANRGEAA